MIFSTDLCATTSIIILISETRICFSTTMIRSCLLNVLWLHIIKTNKRTKLRHIERITCNLNTVWCDLSNRINVMPKNRRKISIAGGCLSVSSTKITTCDTICNTLNIIQDKWNEEHNDIVTKKIHNDMTQKKMINKRTKSANKQKPKMIHSASRFTSFHWIICKLFISLYSSECPPKKELFLFIIWLCAIYMQDYGVVTDVSSLCTYFLSNRKFYTQNTYILYTFEPRNIWVGA